MMNNACETKIKSNGPTSMKNNVSDPNIHFII